MLSKEVVFPLTTCDLGYSATGVGGGGVAASKSVLQRLSYLTKLPVVLLHNSSAEDL